VRGGGAGGAESLVVLSATLANPNTAALSVTPPAAPPAIAAAAPADPESRARAGLFAATSSGLSSLLLSQFRAEDFAKVVKLSDDQKRKFEELSAERDKLTTELSNKIRENRGGEFPNAAARDEMSALSTKRRALEERAVALLTDDQKKGLSTYSDEYRQAQRNRLGAGGFAAPPEVMFGGANIPRDRLGSINRSLERSPNEPRYLLMRAQIYGSEEKWDEAIADYRKVMEIDPRNVAAIMDFAAILALRGDEAGYRQFAEQLLERFGNQASAAEKLRVADACLLRPEWLPNAAAAESMLEKAIEGMPAEPPNPRDGLRIDLAAIAGGVGAGGGIGGLTSSSSIAQELVAAKARLHVLRSQPEEAIKVAKPLLDEAQGGGRRLRPDIEISAWCSMAIAQLSKGDREAATAAINRARSIKAQSPSLPGSSTLTFDLTSKVRLARTEQILGEAGVKPAEAK
jgi:tetratricopeptide (TPR) repeat protein